MFGVGFSEVLLIAIVALVVVGPRRLPEMLGTAGKWVRKLRTITHEMRRQTGIDEILREEGIQGGLNELRSIMRPGTSTRSGVAPMVRTYEGRCHCGAVRFRFRSEEIAGGCRCNCSICIRRGAVMSPAYVPPSDIELLEGKDALEVSRFGDLTMTH